MTLGEAGECVGLDQSEILAIIRSGALPNRESELTPAAIERWLRTLPREGSEQPPVVKPRQRPGVDSAAVFWSHVQQVVGDGCWPWTGATRYCGYGAMLWRGRFYGAHRIAWELTHGQTLTSREIVAHRCDTPACCRPDHLMLTTQGGNLRDMIGKGRDNRIHNSHHRALTADLVRQARQRHAAGESILSLSKAFHAKYATLRSAVRGISWSTLRD